MTLRCHSPGWTCSGQIPSGRLHIHDDQHGLTVMVTESVTSARKRTRKNASATGHLPERTWNLRWWQEEKVWKDWADKFWKNTRSHTQSSPRTQGPTSGGWSTCTDSFTLELPFCSAWATASLPAVVRRGVVEKSWPALPSLSDLKQEEQKGKTVVVAWKGSQQQVEPKHAPY